MADTFAGARHLASPLDAQQNQWAAICEASIWSSDLCVSLALEFSNSRILESSIREAGLEQSHTADWQNWPALNGVNLIMIDCSLPFNQQTLHLSSHV